MTSPVRVRRLDGVQAQACIGQLADILVDCVENGASVSFMLPMTRDKATGFWEGVVRGVQAGNRVLLVAEDDDERVVGTVQIVFAGVENQPHRADISKLLVHSRARRRGVAARLMAAAEEVARDEGLTVLVLDTATGSDAERVYQRAGWQRVGDVPAYALMPDGSPCSTTYYYKAL